MKWPRHRVCPRLPPRWYFLPLAFGFPVFSDPFLPAQAKMAAEQMKNMSPEDMQKMMEMSKSMKGGSGPNSVSTSSVSSSSSSSSVSSSSPPGGMPAGMPGLGGMGMPNMEGMEDKMSEMANNPQMMDVIPELRCFTCFELLILLGVWQMMSKMMGSMTPAQLQQSMKVSSHVTVQDVCFIF